MGQTLHSILAEVLLYIVMAMGLTVWCLPRGTCCQHYAVFVSTTDVALSGAEATVVVAAAADALTLSALALVGEGPLLLAAALVGLLFLVQSVAA
jgi:hypothetical protein